MIVVGAGTRFGALLTGGGINAGVTLDLETVLGVVSTVASTPSGIAWAYVPTVMWCVERRRGSGVRDVDFPWKKSQKQGVRPTDAARSVKSEY